MMKKRKVSFPILYLLLIFWLCCPLSGCQNTMHNNTLENTTYQRYLKDYDISSKQIIYWEAKPDD